MINGTQHCKGIFQYEKGIPFEFGDLVIENNLLYQVVTHNPYKAMKVKPSEDSNREHYKPYVETIMAKSVSEVMQGRADQLVSAQDLLGVLHRYLGGITAKGQIESTIYNINELDNIKDTYMMMLVGPSMLTLLTDKKQLQTILGNEGEKKLFRCYRVDDGTVYQEVLEISSGALFYRLFDKVWSEWSLVPAGSTQETLSMFQGAFKRYQSLIENFTDRMNLVKENLNNYYSYFRANEVTGGFKSNDVKYILERSNNKVRVSSAYIGAKGIITIFYEYIENNLTVQSQIAIAPYELKDGTLIRDNSSSIQITCKVDTTYTEFNLEKTNDSSVRISDVILSKPMDLFS